MGKIWLKKTTGDCNQCCFVYFKNQINGALTRCNNKHTGFPECFNDNYTEITELKFNLSTGKKYSIKNGARTEL